MKKIDRLVEENAWLKSQLAEIVTEKRDLRRENRRLLAEIERLQEALAADAWTRWGNAVAHVRRTQGSSEADGSTAPGHPGSHLPGLTPLSADTSGPSYRVLPER